MKFKRDRTEILASVVVRFAALPASFLTGAILARYLGPEALGYFSLLVTFAIFAATPLFSGWTQFLTREIATARDVDDWGAVNGLFWATCMLAAGYSLAVFVVGLVVVWIGWTSIESLLFVIALSAAYPLAANLGAITRALGWRILGQVPDAIARPVLFLVLIGLYLLSGAVMGAHQALVLQAAAIVAAATLAWLLMRLQLRTIAGYAASTIKVNPRNWLRAFGPVLAITLASAVVTHISLMLTGALANHTETGYYRVAQQTASLAGIGLAGVQSWVMPLLAQAQASRDSELLRQLIRKAQLAALAFALPVVVCVGAFAGSVQAMIFGPEFAASGPVLQILLLNEATLCLFALYHHSLVMSAGAHRALPGLLLCIVLNVGLSVALIPSLGAVGAATSGAIATLAWMLVSFGMYRISGARSVSS
ncbi:oligosaccharide flippase family protein [Devosia sp. CAU 1758]